MSANRTDPTDVKLLPAVGETGRPPAPNPSAEVTAPPPASAITISPSAPRQLADLPRDELGTLGEERGLEPRRFKTPQELVSAIHGRRQLIASLDRDSMLDVVRWGRRPVPINATNEQLAHEIGRIKSMRFDGLSERGLVALARLRGVEIAQSDNVPVMVKKLKKREGIFARMNRKRRAVLGSIVSNMIGESDKSAEYQFLPPVEGAASGSSGPTTTASPATAAAGPDRSIKKENEKSGLFGGLPPRGKKTPHQN